MTFGFFADMLPKEIGASMSVKPQVVDYQLPKAVEVPDFKGDCLGMPTSWWFPPPQQHAETRETIQKAVSICNGCHAKQKCLDFAVSHNSIQGIWGGTTPRQRMRLRRVLLRSQKTKSED